MTEEAAVRSLPEPPPDLAVETIAFPVHDNVPGEGPPSTDVSMSAPPSASAGTLRAALCAGAIRHSVRPRSFTREAN